MASDFTVFRAGRTDGDAVGEIHAEAWRAAYSGFFAPDFFASAVDERRHKWHGVLAEGRTTVLLAARDGRPLAYSCFGPAPEGRPGETELLGFYGHPDSWGSGIAGALMAASLRRMREDGTGLVRLWTLRDTPQSRRFYAKNGFTESGAARDHDFGDGNPVAQVEYARTLR
ncbi:GNAT family N-acetyltransferase [Streptomyces sp. NPDC050504]|uniref:GNAT family N-acetyltransferase n=1 Tax=Streptomyces sp. NPDC050504 TaxID=3365618 RepID=UPI00378EB366